MTERKINPLLIKELRTLLRGKGLPIILNLYIICLGAGLVAMISFAMSGQSFAWEIGRGLFSFLSAFQLVLLCLIAPSITASAISLEKERNTYDVLLASPLALGKVVFHKTLASLVFILLLAFVSAPFMAAGMMLGGITPTEIAIAVLLTLCGVLITGALGLCFSSLFKQTIVSIPIACLTSGALIIGTFIYFDSINLIQVSAYANPLLALIEYVKGTSPGFFDTSLPPWLPSICLMLIGAGVFLSISAELLKFPSRRIYLFTGFMLLLLVSTIMLFDLGKVVSIRENLRTFKFYTYQIALQMMVIGLIIACLDPGSRAMPRCRGGLLRRFFLGLVRFGPGLSGSVVVVMSIIWIASFGWYVEPKSRVHILVGVPVVVGGVVLIFTLMYRIFILLKEWTHSIIPRLLSLAIVCLVTMLAHVLSAGAHIADVEPTKHALDYLLLVSPIKACWSTVYDNIEPYPILADLLQGSRIYSATAVIYGGLSFVLLIALLILRRRKTSKKGGRNYILLDKGVA